MERGGASRPTSFYSQTSTDSCCSVTESKIEMRNLMDSFIADVQRIRETFDDSSAGPGAAAASPARSDPDVDMSPPVPGAYTVEPTTPPEEYEHKGIWCDSCKKKVFGIRHKCLDCYNFDLCNPCMTTKDIQSTHADMPHTFEAIHPPKPNPAPSKAPVPRGRPLPPSATSTQCLCSVLPRPLGCPICKSRGTKDEAPKPTLSYRCDSCQKTIAGTRHRCMTCPDFDLCESCYTAGSPLFNHSPVHRFMHVEHPIRIITAPAVSSESTTGLCAGCAHEGSRYKCENCGAVDLCTRCLGDLEQAIIEHSAFHAEQGWDKPVRFVPYTKEPKEPTPSSSSASASAAVVHPADCDACDKTIIGTRHKCTVCHDFDLCDSCFASGAQPLDHKSDHEMLHLDRPQRIVTHVVAPGNGTPSARPVFVSSKATATPNTLHNAWCDGCSERIRGVRHKCLDCEDFDFCDACLGREHFGGAHEFYALVEPGEVAVRSVRQPAPATPAAPEPAARPRGFANGRVNTTPAPMPPSHHQPRPARPSRSTTTPVTHSAACDLCSSRIRGVRYKCTVCPDYDVCESCFRLSEEVHPGHSFAKIHNQGDIIVRKTSKSSLRHHARCDACQNQILGIRYKCIHPMCPDFDICQRCEALPFPVHPETHAFVKLRSHVSSYDGLTNVLAFAADRGQTPQPQPSTLRVPTPVVRIPSPRVQIPSPRTSRSPAPVIVEPITSTEVFHSATPSPVVPFSTLGCTIVPHTTIVASLPQSPAREPARLSPQVMSPPVIPSPPPIPASLLSHTYAPEKKLTDSWTAASSSAKLDEHKMHHSNMYKPSYEAPPVVPPRPVVEPKPVLSEAEARAAELRQLQQRIAELTGHTTPQESPKPASSPVRVTVQEERDPEAPQMTLLNARPVSLPDVPAREPVVVPEPIPEPIVVSEPELPSLLPAYPYLAATSPVQAPLPAAPSLPSLTSEAPSLASSTSTLSSDDAPAAAPAAVPAVVPILNAMFVEDRSIVDGQVVSGGAEFAKCWRVRNTGTVAWPKGTTVSFVGGDNMLIEPDMLHWAITGDLSPGQDIDVEVDMKAPEEPGHYISYWRFKSPDGEAFGDRVWCDIVVSEPEGAGSSGSSEIAASSIIIPAHAPGMSAASVITSSASPTIHSVPSTVHTRSVVGTASIADTDDIESIGSMESDDSAVWAEVRRQTDAAAGRSEFEMVFDN